MAEQWGVSSRLNLGRPWWKAIGGLQRKRWPGLKGRDKGILKHMYVESNYGFSDENRNIIRGAAVTRKDDIMASPSYCVARDYVICLWVKLVCTSCSSKLFSFRSRPGELPAALSRAFSLSQCILITDGLTTTHRHPHTHTHTRRHTLEVMQVLHTDNSLLTG